MEVLIFFDRSELQAPISHRVKFNSLFLKLISPSLDECKNKDSKVSYLQYTADELL